MADTDEDLAIFGTGHLFAVGYVFTCLRVPISIRERDVVSLGWEF